jgi:hypothetical protein
MRFPPRCYTYVLGPIQDKKGDKGAPYDLTLKYARPHIFPNKNNTTPGVGGVGGRGWGGKMPDSALRLLFSRLYCCVLIALVSLHDFPATKIKGRIICKT